MAKATKPKPKSAAAKRAMAQRGTYAANANSVYGKPYTAGVTAAVAPFNATLKRAQQTWGQRLLECVPPAYAVRYRELVENLDEAMVADDAKAAGDYAGQLCRALPIMHKAAVDAGHAPSSRDIVTTVVDGTVYAFVVRGDLGQARAAHPDWVVYALEDAALALRGRMEDVIQEAAAHFPNVRVVDGSREIVDDEIDF